MSSLLWLMSSTRRFKVFWDIKGSGDSNALPRADVMEYVPDADMIFNYLMISALAAATDYIEREGLKPTGGKLDNVANTYVWCKRVFLWKTQSTKMPLPLHPLLKGSVP